MSVFRFVLLALTAFRLQRVVTSDTWFPAEAFRKYLKKKAKPAHDQERQTVWTELAELFSCPWCFGTWTTIAVFVLDHFQPIPSLVLYIGAAAAIVGYLGNYDD